MDQVNQDLLEIVRRYGTPTYAFDIRRLRGQVAKLRTRLPSAVEILYSLKANASLGICDVLRGCGIGADVASAGELVTAVEAGFSPDRIFVAGPFKLPETLAQLRELPTSVISVDSPSELQMLAEHRLPNPIVLRLRPDFGSQAVVAAGHDSRFGFVGEGVVSRASEFASGQRDWFPRFLRLAGSERRRRRLASARCSGGFDAGG